MELDIIENYKEHYELLSDKNPNSHESIDMYHKWYDTSRLLFDEWIDHTDPDFILFSSVDNGSNGFVLRRNYDKIRSAYAVLMNRIKKVTTKNMEKLSQHIFNKIFIVHGHDELMKLSVARFVESLGLEAVILHEQANSGRTIIQKLLDETSDVSFAIVLYSPCDKGCGAEEDVLKPRARQNVVFEHGLLIGVLGTEKVCCLHSGNVEMPSDNNGVLYVPYDDAGAWKLKLAKEMRGQGLSVDMNLIK